MVNNATNIKKTNNHLEPQVIEHKKRPRHITLEIQLLVSDMQTSITYAHMNFSFSPFDRQNQFNLLKKKKYIQIQFLSTLLIYLIRDRIGFTTTCVISAYHH